jgi:type IV pilus assembly protein PilB
MSSAINIVLAQRLVRKLCDNCKKAIPFDGTVKIEIEKITATIFDKTEIPPTPATVFEAVGCDKCSQTGYKGRIGIYEGMKITPEVISVIEMNPSADEVEKAATPQGILTLKQDGILKVLRGITSLVELERVVTLED